MDKETLHRTCSFGDLRASVHRYTAMYHSVEHRAMKENISNNIGLLRLVAWPTAWKHHNVDQSSLSRRCDAILARVDRADQPHSTQELVDKRCDTGLNTAGSTSLRIMHGLTDSGPFDTESAGHPLPVAPTMTSDGP
jgi:hypothetical protein